MTAPESTRLEWERSGNRLSRAWKLTAAEWRCFLAALFWLALIRLSLALLPWRVVRRTWDRAAGRGGVAAGHNAARIVWAVKAASHRIPGGRNCLVRALAAHTMLARNGHPSQLQIGVRPSAGKPFAAHAWVDHRGQTIIGESRAQYTPLT